MIECPHCGTANDANTTRCQECGQGLNELPEAVDALDQEQEALPPIPDGGLAEHLPDWLRTPLGAVDPSSQGVVADPAAATPPAAAAPAPTKSPDNEPIDPRTFLTEVDFPDWIRQLATPSEQRRAAPSAPWDEPWSAAPAPPELPIERPEPRPRPTVFVPQPALPPSPPAPEARVPAKPVTPLPPPHHDWGRLIGLLVVILVVLAIGLAIILASTDSLP